MEHHRLATSSELMNLSIKYQQIIKRETIRHYVLPEERTQYHPQSCQKKIYSDQTSGSSNQFSGNKEYREHVNGIMSKQAAQSRLQEIQQVKCPEFFKNKI